MLKVVKRNGKKEKFDLNKIKSALEKASSEVNKEDQIDSTTLNIIIYNLDNRINKLDRNINVEEIQDMVEEELINYNYYAIVRHYIQYRLIHKMRRERYSEFMEAIESKLKASNVENQNANVDEHSFSGRTGEAASLMTKQFALDYCMSEKSRNNHLNNEIYIHDLDSYAVGSHNCLSIPFDKLLKTGVKVRQTDIRPAQSLGTAMQLVAVIFQLQSLCQFGGVSATHLDWTMVPYVRKSFAKHYKDGLKYLNNDELDLILEHMLDHCEDYSIEDNNYKKNEKVYKYALDMVERECHQAVEALYHNLNTLQSRSGNQLNNRVAA